MKNDFIDYICRPYCIFFREGEKEDMACQGALAAWELVRRGKIKINDITVAGKDPLLWKNRSRVLEPVCAACPFRKEDCDFRSENPLENCEPCGGYILLCLLHEKKLIDPADIGDA